MTRVTEGDAELHARIAEVQSDIEQNNEALRALESSKSDIQRALNNRTDPFAHLPIEISSKIFTHCVPPRGTFGSLFYPLLLLRICTLWTEIALSTQSLWSNLHINIPLEPTAEFIAFLVGWLARGKDYPLFLSFAGPRNKSPHDEPLTNAEILRVVALHAYRIRDLEIKPHCYLSIFTPNGTSFPILESLRIHETTMTDQRWAHRVDATRICDVLDAAPRLKTLVVDPASFNWSIENILQTRHAALTALQIDKLYGIMPRLLRFLTLPSLTHLATCLHVSRGNTDAVRELRNFLIRSRCASLTSLALNIPKDRDFLMETFEHLFETIPGLLTLRITPDPTILSVLMHPQYLPTLTKLTITLSHPWPQPAWYTTLTTLLTQRVGLLNSFELDFQASPYHVHYHDTTPPSLPGDEDKRIFHQLAEQGMQIHLGRIMASVMSETPES
ncbi:hypothetical protein R3P38DRAFT_3042509 [Favolaschia claudopus]|uniref:F-box domain-containing protein n=1 Tax=Favolaschia claudopus TaxID=2862362 RepID=A0AAW0A9L5_9AGAR